MQSRWVMCRATPSCLLLSLLASACTEAGGNRDGGGGRDGSGACVRDSDCASNQLCGFAASDGCSAVGQCFPGPGAICQAFAPGCACDGTVINIACTGLPQGYFSKPLAHSGACSVPTAACCPASWDLIPCTYPDGGAAFNCHNPALGCASSSVCGVGCDSVAGGRCDGG
jgi:hypothetical protein